MTLSKEENNTINTRRWQMHYELQLKIYQNEMRNKNEVWTNVREVLTRSFFHRLWVSLDIAVILLHVIAQIDPLIFTHYSSLWETEVRVGFVWIDREVLFAGYLTWLSGDGFRGKKRVVREGSSKEKRMPRKEGRKEGKKEGMKPRKEGRKEGKKPRKEGRKERRMKRRRA